MHQPPLTFGAGNKGPAGTCSQQVPCSWKRLMKVPNQSPCTMPSDGMTNGRNCSLRGPAMLVLRSAVCKSIVALRLNPSYLYNVVDVPHVTPPCSCINGAKKSPSSYAGNHILSTTQNVVRRLRCSTSNGGAWIKGPFSLFSTAEKTKQTFWTTKCHRSLGQAQTCRTSQFPEKLSSLCNHVCWP